MKTEYTITKSQVECYKLRHESGLYWADINVDANENKGRIQIASDFGSYQYYWGACGCSFKEFLIKIGIDYAAAKFGEDKWFDFDETIKSYKKTLIQYRREENITTEDAREIYDEIKELEEECPYRENDFVVIIQGKEKLMKFFEWTPSLCYEISPQFKNFWNMVWPVFIEKLNEEISVVA